MKKHSKPSFKFSKKDKFYKPKEKVCTHCVCVCFLERVCLLWVAPMLATKPCLNRSLPNPYSKCIFLCNCI